MSWKPEVLVDGDWCSNSLRFETQAEAEAYAKDLFNRWLLCKDHRAVEDTDPVNYVWDADAYKAVAIESVE